MQRQAMARLPWRRALAAQARRASRTTDGSPLAIGRFIGASSSSQLALRPLDLQAKLMGGWRRGLATRTAPATAAEHKQERRRQKAEVLLPENQSMAYYNNRMKKVLERGDYALATEMLARLRELYPDRPVILTDLYNKLLFLYVQRQRGSYRNLHFKQMLAILDEMIALKRVDSRSFNSVLSACSRICDLSTAQHVLQKMLDAEKNPGAYTYTNLILCCAPRDSNGKVDIAEGYFSAMLNNGIEPSREAIRAMLMVYARAPGRSDKMDALIDRAFTEFDIRVDARSVKVVVEYLLENRKLATAVEFLRKQMLYYGNSASVDGDALSAVLDACRQAREWDHINCILDLATTNDCAEKIRPRLLKLIQDRDDRSGELVWPQQSEASDGTNGTTIKKKTRDVIASKTRLENAAGSNQLGAASRILDDMISRGLADARSFEILLVACNRCGDLDLAETVIEKLKRVGGKKRFDPTLLCYNTVLNCCAEEGDLKKAEQYFQELFSYGIHPDLVTLNTMLKVIGSSCSHQDYDHSYLTRSMQALSIYNWCVNELGIVPDSVTHFALFRVFSLEVEHCSGYAEMSLDDMQGYQEILDAVERICAEVPADALDIGACNAAIDCFLRFDETERVHALLNVLRERSLSLSNATAKLVFASASNAGDSAIGLDFLNYAMANNNFKPTLQVLNGAIELCANTMNPRGALELFNKLESSGFLVPNEESYINLVRAFAFAGNIETALSYARSVKEKLGFGSVPAYNRILTACAFRGQYERSLVIMKEMAEEQELVPNLETFDIILESFVKSGELARGNSAQDEEMLYDEVVDSDDINIEAMEEYDALNHHESESKIPPVSALIIDLLEKMNQLRVSPSNSTYSQAISACTIRGDFSGALEIFDHLIASWKHGTASLECLFDNVTLCEYIKACRNLFKPQRLENLMQLLGEAQKCSSDESVLPSGALLELMNAMESVGGWQLALWMLRNMDTLYGVPPSVLHFNRVMEMCNAAGEFRSVKLIFLTMQNAPAYHVDPNVDSYIQAIYAAEQQEQWTEATNLFMAMQQNCRKDEIWPSHLKKIALGRYSERSRHMELDP